MLFEIDKSPNFGNGDMRQSVPQKVWKGKCFITIAFGCWLNKKKKKIPKDNQ